MAAKHVPHRDFTRRDLMRMGVAGGGALLLGNRFGMAADAPAGKTDVWVFQGTDKKKMMEACLKTIGENGGFGSGAKKLTLKINAAWWRTPEQGANTNPELVDTFLKGCKAQGIKEIVMPENPVDPASRSFPQSGLLDVAKSNNVPMIDLRSDEGNFKEVQLPQARKLKTAQVGKDFLETDVLVNMPVAKHHGSATLTICMKNWMGAVQDRRFFHRNDLLQCIADISSLLKPKWAIIDATRIMLDRGPKGPSKNMLACNQVILSRDQVAADTYATALFPGRSPDKIGYLKYAREMGIGTADPSQIAVHKIEVS